MRQGLSAIGEWWRARDMKPEDVGRSLVAAFERMPDPRSRHGQRSPYPPRPHAILATGRPCPAPPSCSQG